MDWQRWLGFSLLVLLLLASAPTGHAQTTQCPDTHPRPNKHYVTTDLNLRAWASTGADVLATLPRGEIVYAFRASNGWSTVNVTSRYLTTDCIEGGGLTRAALSRDHVVAILMRQSLSRYSGSCPCPDNRDRAGRAGAVAAAAPIRGRAVPVRSAIAAISATR